MTHRLHSVEARRYIRIAQMAGVALGVSAAALWALDVPGLTHREPARPDVRPQSPVINGGRADAQFDRERLDDAVVRLNLGVKRPPPVAKVEPPKEERKPEATASGPAVIFVGAIYEANRTLAVVSVDGRQRIVPEGRLIGDLRLTSVSDDQIVLQDSKGASRQVRRGERSATAVSWVRSAPTAVAMNPAMPGATTNQRRQQATPGRGGQQGAAGFSPEMAQRLSERGIDPQQAQRWREAMREREAQRGAVTARLEGQVAGVPDGQVTITADWIGNVNGDVDGEDAATREQRLKKEMEERGIIINQDDGTIAWTTQISEQEFITEIRRLREDGKVGEDGEVRP